MPTREEVFHAIETERNYQDLVIAGDPRRHANSLPAHSVGDYLTMLATYLRKAQDAWTLNGGDELSLHEIRKIAGIAVHCMEDHGAPERSHIRTAWHKPMGLPERPPSETRLT
jgi:hypothetical protein